MKTPEIAFIGLGRMGKNMVLRLLSKKKKVAVWNRSPGPVAAVKKKGAIAAKTIPELIGKLKSPRIVWLMVPAGKVTSEIISQVLPHLSKGDILIDGGNSNFHDSTSRGKEFAKKGIYFMDVGTSGGVVAATRGYCMMAGGDKKAYNKVVPLFKAMCTQDGYGLMGPPGSGHYVKMIHNAVEYGMMQAISEGFDLLENGRFKSLNLKDISHVWNHGSIVSSFLMEMAEQALQKDDKLSYLKPHVDDTGEGRWSAFEALEYQVPFTVNTHALNARYQSRDKNSFAFRMLSALRNEFGGHEIKNAKKK